MAAHAPVVGAVTEISRTPVHRTGSSKIMGIPVIVALHSPIGAVAAVQVTAVDAPKHVNRFPQVGAARKRRITVKNAGLHEHIIPPGGVPGGHPPAPESPRKVNRVKEIRAREIIVKPGPRPADNDALHTCSSLLGGNMLISKPFVSERYEGFHGCCAHGGGWAVQLFGGSGFLGMPLGVVGLVRVHGGVLPWFYRW